MNIRLKDIADRAGVSVMTVSKVMRDKSDVSAATKERVRKLAVEMGYVPDTFARSLRTGSTKLLGLIISTITNPIFARTALAIEEAAHEIGYSVLLGHSLNMPEREEACIRRMLSQRVEGLLVSPVYRLGRKASLFDDLHKRGLPTVILGHHAPFCGQFPAVETDDVTASRSITEHLLGLGHRRIAFLAGPAAAPWATERIAGYRQALVGANIAPDDSLVFAAGGNLEAGEKAGRQLLAEPNLPSAVQAVNDLVAIGAATVLLKEGIRVPQDISVTGFGNILSSELFRVPLTTVRQPKYRLGVAAMETMRALLRKEAPGSRRMPAELLVRESTGAPGPESLAQRGGDAIKRPPSPLDGRGLG